MTENQREAIIAKMIDAPETLSGEELGMIEHDAELRDIYGISASVSGASLSQPEIDMAEEWALFRPRLQRKPSIMRRVMRLAALWLTICAMGWTVGLVIDKIFSSNDDSPVMASEEKKTPEPEEAIINYAEAADDPVPDTAGATHAGADQAAPSAPKARKRRTDADAPLPAREIDIDEYLRIRQAEIDNDLALITAEAYAAEYENIILLLDLEGETDPVIESTILRVTLQ